MHVSRAPVCVVRGSTISATTVTASATKHDYDDHNHDGKTHLVYLMADMVVADVVCGPWPIWYRALPSFKT